MVNFEKAKNEINRTIEKLERPGVHSRDGGLKYQELRFELGKLLDADKKKLEKELYEIDNITKQYALDKASPFDWMNK